MSHRYASSGGNRTNARPTPSAIAAMIRNDRTKTTPSESHLGAPAIRSRRRTAARPPPAATHREDGQERDERQEQHGHEPEQVAGGARAQEADAHAEEARQQHEVGEEREINDLRAAPPDQTQLDEQHQEAEEDQVGRGRRDRRGSGCVRRRSSSTIPRAMLAAALASLDSGA